MSPVETKFYTLFWQNAHCRDFFLNHKEQILEKEELDIKGQKKSYYLPRIVLSNSLKRPDTVARLQSRIESREIDHNHNLDLASNKNFNEEKLNQYFNEKFARPLQEIGNRISGSKLTAFRFWSEVTTALVSKKRAIKFLKKYHFVPGTVNSMEDLYTHIEEEFSTEIAKYISPERLLDITASLDEVVNFYNNCIFYNLLQANKFYIDILYDTDNYTDRLQVLDMLYDSGTLLGGQYKTHYECINCATGVFSGNVTLNVTPSKVKLKCPNCNKEVFYLAPFKLHDTIFNDIQSKDGLLFHAVKHLCNSKKLPYQANLTLASDIELDFVLLNAQNQATDIIEIKMFKTDRPDDTLISNLRQGLRSFLTSRNKLIKLDANYVHVRFHYLTNIDDSDFFSQIKSDFKSELNPNIFMHNVESFRQHIEQIT